MGLGILCLRRIASGARYMPLVAGCETCNAPDRRSERCQVRYQFSSPMQHAEEVQQDDDADRHAKQPQEKIPTHFELH